MPGPAPAGGPLFPRPKRGENAVNRPRSAITPPFGRRKTQPGQKTPGLEQLRLYPLSGVSCTNGGRNLTFPGYFRSRHFKVRLTGKKRKGVRVVSMPFCVEGAMHTGPGQNIDSSPARA